MIPILYSASETTFTSNGLGRLADAISCTVTEERNGKFELQMVYPVTGVHYSDIAMGCYIAATHNDAGDVQPFAIYRITEAIDGKVTINAHHLSYALNGIVVKPFTAGSVAQVMTKLSSESINTNPFTFWTDKTTSGTFTVDAPSSIRALLGGSAGSILDVYGKGEYEFDKYTVKLHNNRGTATEISIRYGVNLSKYQHSTDDSETYNAVVPFWADEGGGNLVTLTEWYLTPTGTTPSSLKLFAMDLSGDFSTQPTESQLRTKAQSKLDNSEAWIPTENFKVSFVQLWQTTEYAGIASLQRLNLCDTCLVVYGNTSIREKVITTIYDVLRDRYAEMELGEPKTSFANMILKEAAQAVTKVGVTKTALEEAIDHATELITGGLGGHLVINTNASGQPEELLIMDTADTSTAVNVWRFNQGGLGHSHNGYNGPFNDVALTSDGKINASMITTGALDAAVITAGILKDSQNKNSWNLTSGELITTLGNIGGWTISSGGLYKEFTVSGVTYRVRLDAPSSLTSAFISILKKNQDDSWSHITTLSSSGGLRINDTSTGAAISQLSESGLTIYDGGTPTAYLRMALTKDFFKFFNSGNTVFELTSTSLSMTPYNGGNNILLDQNGLAIYYGSTMTVNLTSFGMFFIYDTSGTLLFSVTAATSLTPTSINCYCDVRCGNSGISLGSMSTPFGSVVANGIELKNTTGYVDFHYNNTTTDYTARIIEESSGVLKAYNSIVSASDERLKENITDLSEAEIRLLQSLKPKRFNFIGNDTPTAGLVAQDVLEAEKEAGIDDSLLVRGTGKEIPDPKHEGETMTDYYAVDYNSLTTLLLAQVQSLTKEVERLKVRIDDLEGGR